MIKALNNLKTHLFQLSIKDLFYMSILVAVLELIN
jgi:hypothetical protein